MKKNSYSLKILLALFSFSATCGTIEIVLRLFNYKPTLSSSWVLDHKYRILDDDLITVDRHFLNDAFYDPFRVQGSTDFVVTLGDSFTAGFPVKETDSYPSVLERIFQDESFDVRVMNAGLGDTGPDQQLKLFIKYILPRLSPHIVIWQFYPNDPYDNAIRPLFSISDTNTLVPLDARDNWTYRRQRFYQATPLPSAIKRGSYLFHLLLRTYEKDLTSQVPAGRDPTAWGREKIALEIVRMNELARQHGFEVYYVLIAPQSVYRDEIETGMPGYWQAIEYPKLLAILEKEPNFIQAKFESASLGENLDPGTDLFLDGTHDPAPLGTDTLTRPAMLFLHKELPTAY